MVLLGVNIDHVASIRQARYRSSANSPTPGVIAREAEPDPVLAAHEAILGGADIITVHLREDRRHIHDRDLELIASMTGVRLNLEMGATDEMISIACRLRANLGSPHMCTLVPEGRNEVTTEGGLGIAGQLERMRNVVARLHTASLIVSAFIDAKRDQIDAARAAGFDACEIHTGPYAAAFLRAGGDPSSRELSEALDCVQDCGRHAVSLGLRFHAGHALNYANVGEIARSPGIAELHIGHAIVSRAVYTGLRTAVADMQRAIRGV
jgi:pyridoxine 5-phosphate synthase